MLLYHDSWSSFCRVPQGAAVCGTEVTLRLMVDSELRNAFVCFIKQKENWIPMDRTGENVFEAKVKMPEVPGLCWYYFQVEDLDGNLITYCACPDGLGGEGTVAGHIVPWQITVYDAAYQTPEWLRRGVMYQIFPDRFARSGQPHPIREERTYHNDWNELPMLIPEGKDTNCARDFFGGDLRGIQEKLPVLKDLGVTVLYLNPIFSSRSNHRYDTADYTQVDELLGNNEDFTALCDAAREAGIRVMLDGVFSHTGEDSVYFNKLGRYSTVGAYQSPDSPYAAWYTFEQFPDKYQCWWNFHTLPNVDENNESYRQFMLSPDGIGRRWVRAGSSGWRLDVADELPMRFLRDFRTAVKTENPDAAVLGEVWEDASHKETYGELRCYCAGDTLDSVMNYPVRDAAINFFTGKTTAFELRRVLMSQKENYPKPFYYSLMNLAGSHDRARIINVLAGKTFEELPPPERRGKQLTEEEYALGKKRYIQLMRLLCALPGIPCVYYGDEIGMQGGSDPFCRGPYAWGKEDAELKEGIRHLLRQRNRHPEMQTGDIRIVALDEDTLVITREISGGRDVFGSLAQDARHVVTVKRT